MFHRLATAVTGKSSTSSTLNALSSIKALLRSSNFVAAVFEIVCRNWFPAAFCTACRIISKLVSETSSHQLFVQPAELHGNLFVSVIRWQPSSLAKTPRPRALLPSPLARPVADAFSLAPPLPHGRPQRTLFPLGVGCRFVLADPLRSTRCR